MLSRQAERTITTRIGFKLNSKRTLIWSFRSKSRMTLIASLLSPLGNVANLEPKCKNLFPSPKPSASKPVRPIRNLKSHKILQKSWLGQSVPTRRPSPNWHRTHLRAACNLRSRILSLTCHRFKRNKGSRARLYPRILLWPHLPCRLPKRSRPWQPVGPPRSLNLHSCQ